MPPKPKSPAKGKGKGKLSKAEKEKLKKEEEAQKLREEEEERLRKEQEEKERLERERLEREERERILAAEHQRHAAEVAELRSILEGNKTALTNMHDARRSKAKWDRYMRCDGSPDPTVPAEINTYINLWKDDREKNDIDAVLKESKLTLALIHELEFLLDDTPEDVLTEDLALRYQETVVELENLLVCKLDEATVLLLKGASGNADTETGNLQFVKGSEDLALMLWGNLTKNPRFKSFTFEDQEFTFELPKQLALSDIAIRVVHTTFDHYSHRCRTFRPKKKKKPLPPPEEVPEEPPQPDGEGEKPEGEEGEGQEEGENEGEVAESELGEKEEEKSEVAETVPATPAKEEEAAKTQGEGEEGEGEEEDEEEEEEEYEMEDEDTVDLRAYHVLGGVIHFDLLSMPPQPKPVKSWVMTQVSSNELKRVPYMNSDKLGASMSGTLTLGQTMDAKALASNAAAAEALGAPPIGVTVKLPDNVLFSEEPQMAYWMEEGKQWRLDGFVDIKFEQENRTLSFKTVKFGPLACIQDKHINMPFQSWELFPLALNHCRFTIMAAILEVEIEIKGHLCSFRQTGEGDPHPELESISGKWMAPRVLIEAMKSAGVNLFPEVDSKKYVSISEKDEDTEAAAYEQMALTASHFAYSWSKWNAETSSEKIVVLGCEKLQPELVKDEEWALLMMSRQQTFKLKMGEYDEEFSEGHAEGTNFHADLYHMVCDLSSETGLERMRNSDFQFVDAVHQLLAATRIIAYS